MRVDAPGLITAAQRLAVAVQALNGSGGAVPHPPLAVDPASLGAAERLSTASAALTEGLSAHAAALVASLEHLTGTAITFTETDTQNAAALATLNTANSGPAPVTGSAPPPPPVPPDVRAPLPPAAAGMMPEALSAAVHSGTPGAEEPFAMTWSTASSAARATAEQLRTAVAQLPEVLDGPASTPAASRHLLAFAAGLEAYADRGHALARQASAYATSLSQARESIPTPQQFVAAQNRITALQQANAASGGRYAAPLAQAIGEKNQLGTRTTSGHTAYQANLDAETAGTDPGQEGSEAGAGGPGDLATAGDGTELGDGLLDAGADLLSPEGAGEMSSMLPQMIPTVLGAVGGLAGGLMGAATKVPQSLMQAGSQAMGAATQGLSGLGQPKMDLPDSGLGDGLGDGGMGDGLGGGDAPTTPAGGEGAPASLGVAPSTGAPPTPTVTPVGATTPAPAAGGMGGQMGGMGMPMGGMGGGAPGGGGAGGGKDDPGRQRKVVSRDIPHTEDITGRTDTNRLAVASAATREHSAPEGGDDPPPDSSKPVVRRLTTRPPKEPT